MSFDNLLLMTDSYKHSHPYQYPRDTHYLHFYLESRGTANKDLGNYTKFFGLQYYVKKYLSQPITQQMIDDAEKILLAHGLPFYRSGFEKILNNYNGYLPIRIRAVREGSLIPLHNVLMTIESTDEELFWLPGFVETLLLKVWYPTTVATISFNIKQLIKRYLLETADSLDKLDFMLHDFGYRGVSSEESAGIGGAAHLTNFLGTDTLAALHVCKEFYAEDMAGFSIPASEHSTMTSWGVGTECEREAFENMIAQFGDNSVLYACVSDSWDFKKAIQTWVDLKDKVTAKKANLVIRPDSGDAVDNILYALYELDKGYGSSLNSKGYKVLNKVALIQGDSVSISLAKKVLEAMKIQGYSAENIAFGMGGALLQGNYESSINRDSFKFAIKCSAIMRGNTLIGVKKEPITDLAKKSKQGRLDLIKDAKGNYKTIVLDDSYALGEYHPESQLQTYYDNGEIKFEQSLAQIRNYTN
ncbi:nicotinate phosphoribosyltransferase [Francisella tularensis subsp. novicida]|uniref:Nicotinamide phosphoribosyltransferase n=2 Tax=Francisella tularensis TaxID=263 RepID=A0A6I4RUI9_FRATU|nr:nicotinate phosphoribosyltransferase [Francisella tularensis]ABK90311.1 nicotinic acid phosphoribosyltransferase [Francisella tularensis subsp. novicida U112]AJI44665.1 nicotinate phosphoribosyltransferase family protein [Francisella tularensis subsp. novicida F6168]AJI60829.1 nicotinate phosphoribosyltransferase family protein [Francisella tularensis subsp. novicida U112]AJJ46561.1 nicotinate phosphoribosyltransferase family protein [Francisella tularensis subsp. novicida]APC94437.1 nicoti